VRVTAERYLSLQEVGDELGVSDQTVRRWVKSGELAAYKPGKEYRIRGSALEEFLASREVHPKVEAPPRDPKAQKRREFLEHIKTLEGAALQALSDEIDEEYMRVRPEWERAKETRSPEFVELSTQLEDVSARGMMVRLQMRIAANPDARYTSGDTSRRASVDAQEERAQDERKQLALAGVA